MPNGNNDVEISLKTVSILKYLAYVVWVLGLVGSILWCVGASEIQYETGFGSTSPDPQVTYRIAVLCGGFVVTLLAGGILYGLSYLISLVEDMKNDKENGTQSMPNLVK